MTDDRGVAAPRIQPFSWERMIRAVENVRNRLFKATAALETAGLPYAVTGGNAVAAWVAGIDEAAVRNAPDIDLIVRRGDFERARAAFEAAGLQFCHTDGAAFFLEEDASSRDAVRVRFAGEYDGKDDCLPLPDVTEVESIHGMRVLSLDSLVRMELLKLKSVNRVHLRDLIEVGLVDENWVAQLSPPLNDRLKAILDDPDG